MSGRSLGCYLWGEGGAAGIWWGEARDIAKRPTMPRTVP